ncbi:MAG TPA: ComEA family DNA-binding protein [Pseudonocardiaceae bacterium]|nr:ComEA family DNA-binding protein [Pseudonocardiaceae bacterium]
MAGGLFGAGDRRTAAQRVAWLAGSGSAAGGPAPPGAGPAHDSGERPGGQVRVVDEDDAVGEPATGLVHAGDDAGATHSGGGQSRRPVRSVKVGWRIRRWLPPGTTEVRMDPGRRAAVVLAAVLLLGAAAAGFGVWRSRPVAETIPVSLPSATSSDAAPNGTGELVVSVAGQVVRPGLVRLPPGARVADAVTAAGGPVPGADLTGLNLARRLTDGEHVVVGPAPMAAGAGAAGTGGSGAGGSGAAAGARVDLNTATLADLDALPGVGPVTAQRILDWREQHGRFTSIDQLREIEGIGETRFARLRDLVTA